MSTTFDVPSRLALGLIQAKADGARKRRAFTSEPDEASRAQRRPEVEPRARHMETIKAARSCCYRIVSAIGGAQASRPALPTGSASDCGGQIERITAPAWAPAAAANLGRSRAPVRSTRTKCCARSVAAAVCLCWRAKRRECSGRNRKRTSARQFATSGERKPTIGGSQASCTQAPSSKLDVIQNHIC